MSLVKAEIHVDSRDAEVVGNRIRTSPIQVQFNPTTYSVNKSLQIAEIAIPGLDTPLLQFVRGQNEQLTMELFFDTTIDEQAGVASEATTGLQAGEVAMDTDAQDVREKTRDLLQLVKVQPELHAPPRVCFVWGSLSFVAIIESIQQEYTLFSPTGIPLRARMNVTFREYKTLSEQLQETPRESADHTKRRVVGPGDTLYSIAAREYRDPRLWRPIAEANDIANPRQVTPGRTLLIPPLQGRERART